MKLNDFNGLIDFGYEIRLDAVSELTLNYLMNIAEKALLDTPQTGDMQEVTAVITSTDNIYTGTTTEPDWGSELIAKLQEQNDTQVTHMVTMIRSDRGTGPDISSFAFRKALMDLNSQNAYALMVLQGHECLRARTIASTMP